MLHFKKTGYFELNIVHGIFILIVGTYKYLFNPAFHLFSALLI